jgi:hypothetical protein
MRHHRSSGLSLSQHNIKLRRRNGNSPSRSNIKPHRRSNIRNLSRSLSHIKLLRHSHINSPGQLLNHLTKLNRSRNINSNPDRLLSQATVEAVIQEVRIIHLNLNNMEEARLEGLATRRVQPSIISLDKAMETSLIHQGVRHSEQQ